MTRGMHSVRRLRLERLEDRLAPATFNVTTNLDLVDPADGKRSLREAVNAANNLAGADVIVLPAGVFRIALDGANENVNATGDFDVTGAVTIRGAGAGLTIIDAQRKDRLFDVIGDFAARFVDVTLRGGGGANNGGAVQALDADLTFVRCAVIDNQSLKGGGVNAENGDVTVTGSTFARNSAQITGGGLNLEAGALSLIDSVVRRNAAGIHGGAVFTATATLSNTAVSANFAGESGGGISAESATLNNSTVNSNTADFSGGGIDAESVTLTNCTVSGNTAGRDGGGMRAAFVAALTDCIVSGNSAGISGGGIYASELIATSTATLTRCTVSGNRAGMSGGGIGGNTVSLGRSTISGNFAVSHGGGIHAGLAATVTRSTVSGNSTDGSGGGISISLFSDLNTATVTRSTVSGNRAGGSGGGIDARVASLTNSTLSGNSAGESGGGLRAIHADVQRCTIADNFANTGGGLFHEPGGNFNIRNTIVALNLVDFAGAGPDVAGPFTSQGHNLIGDGSGSLGFTDGVNGDIVGTNANPIDPKLGPLANNGGRTRTHALKAGSRAIDRGDNSLLPQTDQRGLPRTKDGNGDGIARVDIGAFEK